MKFVGMIDGGYREIVLTGVHLGHYGVDFNKGKSKEEWTRLSHLVRQIVALDPAFRVRLSSIEATEVTPRTDRYDGGIPRTGFARTCMFAFKVEAIPFCVG